MSPLITGLNTIKHLAAERRDEFEVMRYTLEAMYDEPNAPDDAEIDRRVDAIAAPIIAAIDCTQCANCCRALLVSLVPDDADRLSAAVDIPIDQVIERYVDLERGEEVSEWGVFKERPCVFLKGNLCSIYAHRPDSCRLYPQFTPDFRWTLEHTIAGTSYCPIIYNVVSQLCEVVDEW
jgi:Fe-S-cluster containining protein